MTRAVRTDTSGFGVENLPFGVARRAGGATTGVSALGARVVDLSVLARAGSFAGLDLPERIFEDPTLNRFLECGRTLVESVRRRLAEVITSGDDRLESASVSRRAVDLLVPVAVGDFVDFHGSLHHARNMGRLMRPGTDPIPPHWRRLPRAYHGRAGAIVPSGTPVTRPYGQFAVAGEGGAPVVGVTRALDYEVEVGFVVGVGNEPGRPVPASAFADHVAGLVLVNDWSARDVQRLESQPLGPYLGKSFATSVSPWLVTLDALEPYRVDGPRQDPPPPPYLAPPKAPAYDIRLEVAIQSQWMRVNEIPAATVSRTCFADQYWTFPQMLAHATLNGAAVRPGDLFASGTVSGPDRGSEGCLMELAGNGEHPVALPDGTTREFLEDGDTVTITGWAGGDGRPLLCVGEVSGAVRAARRLEV
ncbi:MAG: fumarylacetoacetase [Actinomycetota bacterium]|nr:fumarylacetoacetase [Actinomycetota bacterium]